VSYEEYEVRLAPGEVLMLYTDGLPDAVNAASEEFGMRRVIEVVRRCYTGSADALIDALTSAVQIHSGLTEPFDDVTMMVIKRRLLTDDALN